MPGNHPIDVRLRAWADDDFPLLERLLGDPAMTRYLGGPESAEKLRDRHQRYLRPKPTDHVFAIVVGPEHASAGWLGYWESSWQDARVWEIGWNVLPEFQGRGVATAAARLAIEHARADGRHRFMHAFPSVDNTPSNALCRRLGFVLLGAIDSEYPPGNPIRSNNWRLDLVEAPPRP